MGRGGIVLIVILLFIVFKMVTMIMSEVVLLIPDLRQLRDNQTPFDWSYE